MEGRKTLKLTNQNQFESLVEFMEKNITLARGFSKGIQRTDVKKEWAAIAEQLNSKGPPFRDGDGWQKVWADMKHNVKKKIVHNSKELKVTGGGPNQLKILSQLEEAVANLLNFEIAVNPKGTAIGISQPGLWHVCSCSKLLTTAVPSNSKMQATAASLQELEDVFLENSLESEDKVPVVQPHESKQSEALLTAGRKRRHSVALRTERSEFLRKQSALQEITLNGINDSLRQIQESIKEIQRYQRKSFRLKEETATRDAKRLKIQEDKFVIYKKEMERKEAHRKENNKIKMMELEIKRRQIEIEEKKIAYK